MSESKLNVKPLIVVVLFFSMGVIPISVASIVPVPPLPPFLSDLRIITGTGFITPTIDLGEDVTIRFDIMNPNNQSINYNANISIGELTLLVDVELDAYEIKTIIRTLTPEAEGWHEVTVDGMFGVFNVIPIPLKLGEFVVSELTVIDSEFGFEEGDSVHVSVNVTNIGEIEGTYTVDFKVNGETIETDTLTIAGGDSVMSSFGVSWGAGTYQVSVEDLTTDFTVMEKSLPTWIIGVSVLIIVLALIAYIRFTRFSKTP